jgi:hypothetical protein
VSRSQEQLGRAVPDCDDDFVAAEEGVEGFVEESGKTEIPDLYLAARGYHDICGFEVSVQDPVGMKILTTIQELEHDAFDCCRGNWVTGWLRVVMDDLEEIMLGVFENHVDTLTFQDDFNKPDHIDMTQLGTEGHLSDR